MKVDDTLFLGLSGEIHRSCDGGGRRKGRRIHAVDGSKANFSRPLVDADYSLSKGSHCTAGAGLPPISAGCQDAGRLFAVRRHQRARLRSPAFRRAGAPATSTSSTEAISPRSFSTTGSSPVSTRRSDFNALRFRL